MVNAKHAVPLAFGLLVVGGLLFLAVAFMGGPKIVWLNLKPGPDPEELTTERGRVVETLEIEIEKAAAGSPLSQFAEARHDQCYKGQNDGKVDEGFAHRCTAKLTRYYGFNGDFRRQYADLDRRWRSLGWVIPNYSDSVEQTLVEYFDGDHRKPNATTGEIYLVERLPTPCYDKKDLKLCIEFAERLTTDLYGLGRFQEMSEANEVPYFEKKQFVDIAALFKKITADNEYVAAVSIRKHYFEN